MFKTIFKTFFFCGILNYFANTGCKPARSHYSLEFRLKILKFYTIFLDIGTFFLINFLFRLNHDLMNHSVLSHN